MTRSSPRPRPRWFSEELLQQLAPNGILVIPVGLSGEQEFRVIVRQGDIPVRRGSHGTRALRSAGERHHQRVILVYRPGTAAKSSRCADAGTALTRADFKDRAMTAAGKLIAAALLGLLLASCAARRAPVVTVNQAPVVQPSQRVHVVVHGDTLYAIAWHTKPRWTSSRSSMVWPACGVVSVGNRLVLDPAWVPRGTGGGHGDTRVRCRRDGGSPEPQLDTPPQSASGRGGSPPCCRPPPPSPSSRQSASGAAGTGVRLVMAVAGDRRHHAPVRTATVS